MFYSIAALLAFATHAFAASPAAATYCSEDNLLRAFQHTPTPASSYCTTATGYPTFLAVTSYPATRLSSACSCFSRFPVDAALPTPPATSTSACYSLSGTGKYSGITYSIIFKLDKTKTCGTGFLVTSMCGTATTTTGDISTISLDTTSPYITPDYCFDTTTGPDTHGVNFKLSGDTETLNIHHADNPFITGSGGYYEFILGSSLTAIDCSASAASAC